MSVVIDGTLGITSPAETVQGALTTTGNTILGDASTDTLNVGNGGLVKDASGNVGIGTASPQSLLDLTGNDPTLRFTDNAGSPAATWSLRSNDANFSVRSVTAGADRLVIDSAGASTFTGTGKFATTIGVGNATPAASGSGITFPATQSASSDANTLDDYEEGTFTPTLAGGFSSGPTSYAYQAGCYEKIGKLVYFQLDISPVGATSSASVVTIGGLPFTSATSPAVFGGGNISYQSGFDTNAGDTFHITVTTTQVIVYSNNGGGGRLGNAANVNINGRIILFGTYLTA